MQVAQVAVPLLMHSAGLPGGADVLWKALDEDFHSEDWRVRTKILVFLLFYNFLCNHMKLQKCPLKLVLIFLIIADLKEDNDFL